MELTSVASDRDDDAVGYKRPPKHGQFRPGQSGNPRGRRKNVRNFKTDLLEELREQITIRENGRERRISKQRAFIKALVTAAIKGDMRATNALVSFRTRTTSDDEEQDLKGTAIAEDGDIVEAFLARDRQRRRNTGGRSSSKKLKIQKR
jgi:hypothetical protein